MNFTENLPRSGEHSWGHLEGNTGKNSQTEQAIFNNPLYVCTCFWKHVYWKIIARKTKFSSMPTKKVKSGISKFVRHKDQFNALELHLFSSDVKLVKEQCRQLLNESAFLSYVSQSKPTFTAELQ